MQTKVVNERMLVFSKIDKKAKNIIDKLGRSGKKKNVLSKIGKIIIDSLIEKPESSKTPQDTSSSQSRTTDSTKLAMGSDKEVQETKLLQLHYNRIRASLDKFLFDISAQTRSSKKMKVCEKISNFLFKDSKTQTGALLPSFVDSLNTIKDDQVLYYNRRIIIDETQIILNEFTERLDDIMKIIADKIKKAIL